MRAVSVPAAVHIFRQIRERLGYPCKRDNIEIHKIKHGKTGSVGDVRPALNAEQLGYARSVLSAADPFAYIAHPRTAGAVKGIEQA